jgi:signal peptidase II
MQAARGTSLSPGDDGPEIVDPRRGRIRLQALLGVVAATAYALDLWSKEWALANLRDGDIPVVGDLLVLHLTFNPGAAFSAGTNLTPLLTVIAIAACLVVLWLATRVGSLLWAVGLGLLLGGAGGNLTDRLIRDPGPFRGHVVDFLQLPNWPVFNIADICINAAVVAIVIQLFRGIRVDGEREER